MAGFSVANTKAVLNSPGAMREFKTSLSTDTSRSLDKAIKSGGLDSTDESSFATTMKQAMNDVNALQLDANKKIEQLSTGKTHNVPEVMTAVEKADIALRMMMQVRNKALDAYSEVMKMQL